MEPRCTCMLILSSPFHTCLHALQYTSKAHPTNETFRSSGPRPQPWPVPTRRGGFLMSILSPCQLYLFPVAASTNDHKHRGLKQQECVILQFWRSEIGDEYYQNGGSSRASSFQNLQGHSVSLPSLASSQLPAFLAPSPIFKTNSLDKMLIPRLSRKHTDKAKILSSEKQGSCPKLLRTCQRLESNSRSSYSPKIIQFDHDKNNNCNR